MRGEEVRRDSPLSPPPSKSAGELNARGGIGSPSGRSYSGDKRDRVFLCVGGGIQAQRLAMAEKEYG